MFWDAMKGRGVPASPGQKYLHFEASELTGAFLDKAGAIHPETGREYLAGLR
jgi:hypothetical protein